VWLYFLLAGGILRKRALQSVFITAVIGLMACLWLSHVAPGWMHDWHANLATISARGGINEPGPDSVSGRSIFMVVDLQAAISVFRNDPAFYNAVSYAICGAFLLAWAAWTLRTRFTVEKAWQAMGAAAAFTMLITYHRPWDAKLVMLAIPSCCLLWARRGRVGKIGFLITATAVLFAGDVPLSAVTTLASYLKLSTAGLGGQLLALVLIRPESIALLAMGIFYFWVYLRRAHGLNAGASAIQEIHGVSE